MPICSKCRRNKSSNFFHKNRSTTNGLSAYCKSCKKKSTRRNYEKHRTQILEKVKIYRKEKWDRHAHYLKWYYNPNSNARKAYDRGRKKYLSSLKGKITRRRNQAKRKGLGFIPLNEPFPNSDAHHIDRNHVIYIPTTLHKSIHHRLSNPESMARINALTYYFLATST